ncbi:hypothetical protein [Actinoallomurus rhizosphaericola]|uniref:hypothetical protein n=1 Tax=Actinoallomurus rhizosphaericola TaxID=2952536 RepID=UPI00209208AF|nr:hypothetical protein [Actinoallomurus rhizosphaericola]MCO5997424.1 hypothetical protein [Actinoallomurus rhizosphaericola]
MRGKTIPALLLAPALLLGLPACGSGHEPANAQARAAGDLAKMRAYARCMRANGVDMADPQADGNGGFRIGIRGGSGKPNAAKGTDDTTLKAAEAKCGRLRPNGGKPKKPSAADLAKMRAYARCMREHGVDMPDPNPDGGIVIKRNGGQASPGGSGQAGPDSQTFKDADKACAQYRPGGAGSRHLSRSGN